jgi:hypothetical protein
VAAIDEAIDALYARPLAEFTPARDALAAQLKKTGARDDAARVKALSKPAVSPWAVNQLHHRARAALDAFFESVGRLREAQRVGSADDFRAAQASRRESLQALLREAETRLQESGHAASPATLQRIERTLEALAVNGWPGGAQGRLAEDLEPPGFDAFSGLPPAGPPKPSEPKRPPVEAKAAVRERREAQERAESELAESQEALRQAKKAAAQAAADSDRARQAQAQAQDDLQRAAQRSREATERAERAAFEARQAATALSEAERRVEAARTVVDRLRRMP